MKTILVVVLLAVAVCCQDSLPDPHVLLKDTPRLARFISCMQGKDSCEPFAAHLRAQLPEALRTSCAGCDKVQKTFIRVVSLDLIKNHAQDYKVIEDYFDKERKYEKSFDAFLHGQD